jgi:hypothetical protein
MSSIARWEPDAFTVARGNALQGMVPYAPGTEIAVDGEATQRSIPASVAAFAQWITTWPGIRSAGMRRSPAKPSTAGRRRDLHEEGRAVDAMIAASNTPEGDAAGDALSAFLVQNADRLGVQGLIWRGREWYASRSGAAWEPYDGGDPHTSHPHIELSPEALGWSADEMRRRIADVVARPAAGSSSSGGSFVGAFAVAGLGAVIAYAITRWRR